MLLLLKSGFYDAIFSIVAVFNSFRWDAIFLMVCCRVLLNVPCNR
jgi:hypothetical protein